MDLLSEYKNKQAMLLKEIENGAQNLTILPILQEVCYRIMVLENLQNLMRLAPKTLEQRALGYHFGLLKMNLGGLLTDRKIGLAVDETEKAKRATASESLNMVINGAFTAFKPPQKDTEYKDSVGQIVCTVLPVWIQYRDTYIKL